VIGHVASIATAFAAQARVVYDDGSPGVLTVPPQAVVASDRTGQVSTPSDLATQNGWIVGFALAAGVVVPGGIATGRGQFFAVAVVGKRELGGMSISRRYAYDGWPLGLGDDVEPGPGGGNGFLSWREVFHDRAGDAATLDSSLAVTNAFRRIHGVAHYYHASSDVATRTFIGPRLLNVGPTKPTGWTTGGLTGWQFAWGGDVTLTVDEEGFFLTYSRGKDGMAVRGDNGTLTVESTATNPTPFPLEVTEDDLAVIRFTAVTTGHANDRQSAYILTEEWLVFE
jgi:hypothetical protein